MKSKPAQHSLTDRDGDRASFWVVHDGRIFVTVSTEDTACTAGGFTRAQLVEALDAVAPDSTDTCPDLGAHWRLDEAMDRAEKAERERDEWKDSAIKAMADLERAEQPRPLTPDDAMVLRALNADMWEEHKVGPWGSLDSFRTPAVDAMRAVLTAALTVPKRPEGAEEMEALIGSWERSELLGQNLTTDDLNSLADHLAERVASVSLTPTNPEETP